MKVTVLIRHEHEALRALIDKFKKTSMRKQGRTLFQEIRSELQIHSQMASEVFYSALAATPSDRAVALVEDAKERCDALEKILKELSRMSPSDENFDARMNVLIEEIGRHIEIEEDELFHEARKTLPEYRLEELGLEMQSRRETLKLLAVV